MIEVCSFKSINALTGAKRRLALKKNTKTTRPRENAGHSYSYRSSRKSLAL